MDSSNWYRDALNLYIYIKVHYQHKMTLLSSGPPPTGKKKKEGQLYAHAPDGGGGGGGGGTVILSSTNSILKLLHVIITGCGLKLQPFLKRG